MGGASTSRRRRRHGPCCVHFYQIFSSIRAYIYGNLPLLVPLEWCVFTYVLMCVRMRVCCYVWCRRPNQSISYAGYQQLVRAEPFRGKYRNSFEHPEPFVPDEASVVEFTLPDICHCFRKGHRIMVHVQSSFFPIVDRNPQTFCNIFTCGEEAFQKATQRVHLGSCLKVLTL